MSDSKSQKSETRNIRKAAWEEIKRAKGTLATLLLIGVFGDALFIFFLGELVDSRVLLLSWIPLVSWVFYLIAQARKRFWKDFAKAYGWTYKSDKTLKDEEALIFHEGHSQKIGHSVAGEYEGAPARIFEYQFTRGHGKHQTTYYYTAFGFRFSGRFPHCYLNHLDAGYDISNAGVRIPVPHAFEKEFHLYGPLEYEIEILEIFTPDILQFFLDEEWAFDVELVDQELLVFWQKRVNTRKELNNTFDKTKELVHTLTPVLNRVSFEPIGDRPHVLS